jgi:hypothetical protein
MIIMLVLPLTGHDGKGGASPQLKVNAFKILSFDNESASVEKSIPVFLANELSGGTEYLKYRTNYKYSFVFMDKYNGNNLVASDCIQYNDSENYPGYKKKGNYTGYLLWGTKGMRRENLTGPAFLTSMTSDSAVGTLMFDHDRYVLDGFDLFANDSVQPLDATRKIVGDEKYPLYAWSASNDSLTVSTGVVDFTEGSESYVLSILFSNDKDAQEKYVVNSIED